MRERSLALLVLAVLARTPGSEAEDFTVGPAGEYRTIQAALTDASLVPTWSSIHVKIQSGTYQENLRLRNPCCSRRYIRMSGGWNATFTRQDLVAEATVVDGGSRNRVFSVPNLNSGGLELSLLTLRGGYLQTGGVHGVGAGAGLQATLEGDAELVLRSVVIRNNTIRGADGPNAEGQGAGAMVMVRDTASFRSSSTRFLTNVIVPGNAASIAARGGGLYVRVTGGFARVDGATFEGNWSYGHRISYGGGLYASVERGGGFGFSVEESTFKGNVVENANGEGAGASVITREGDGATAATISRCHFVSHLVGQSQLDAGASGGTRIRIGDSLIADGHGGLRMLTNAGEIHATNLTVANNDLEGIRGTSTNGRISVYNSIAYRNSEIDLLLRGDAVTEDFNLVDVDPRFVPGRSYRLDGGSPAADEGTNTPPAGRGARDLAGNPRVYNETVDIGAFEWSP